MKRFEKLEKYMTWFPTNAEFVLLERLEGSGMKFRHQFQVGIHYVHFMIPSKLVAIIIDTDCSSAPMASRDKKRDDFLRVIGFEVFHVADYGVDIFDIQAIKLLGNAEPSEIGRVMGRSGNIRQWAAMDNRRRAQRTKARKAAKKPNRNRNQMPVELKVLKMTCEACGKVAEYRTRKSAVRWGVHCSCGGKLVLVA